MGARSLCGSQLDVHLRPRQVAVCRKARRFLLRHGVHEHVLAAFDALLPCRLGRLGALARVHEVRRQVGRRLARDEVVPVRAVVAAPRPAQRDGAFPGSRVCHSVVEVLVPVVLGAGVRHPRVLRGRRPR